MSAWVLVALQGGFLSIFSCVLEKPCVVVGHRSRYGLFYMLVGASARAGCFLLMADGGEAALRLSRFGLLALAVAVCCGCLGKVSGAGPTELCCCWRHSRWALCRHERPRHWKPQHVRAAVDELIFYDFLAVACSSSAPWL